MENSDEEFPMRRNFKQPKIKLWCSAAEFNSVPAVQSDFEKNLEIRAPFLNSSNSFLSVFSIYYKICIQLRFSSQRIIQFRDDFVIYRKYREKIIG